MLKPLDSSAWATLLSEPGLADLGPGPRAGVWAADRINEMVDRELGNSRSRAAVRALLLLWHDHHDEAHGIVQDMPGRDGSLIHAILHRREPDFGNASYWFHRVPGHPAYPAIASRVSGLLAAAGDQDAALCRRLVKTGEWDALAFVSACERASELPDAAPQWGTLQTIQGFETQCVLEHLLSQDPSR